jgi:hypothetical protein
VKVGSGNFMPDLYLSCASKHHVRIETIMNLTWASRQIPYAIGQFTVNEFCHELAFRSMSEEKRRNLSATAKGAISLGSGLTAGVAAAVLSQPADTLLSQVGSTPSLLDLL